MFQCVVLSVSSHVIMCHRRRKKTRDGKTGKAKAKAGGTHRVQWAEENKDARKPRTRKTVLCRVGSELSLVPASLCHSIRQEEDFVREILTAWIHWDIKSRQKYRRRMFFGYCPMRRRSLRLLSPDRFHNSDGDTGAFFRVKNYRREFFARKPEA